MTPAQYRNRTLVERDRQTRQEIAEKSNDIHTSLYSMAQIQQAKHIFTYLHFRSEVETEQLVNRFLQQEKTISVPLCHVNERRLTAIDIVQPNKELAPGAWGIPEPLPEFHHRQRDPTTIDIILLPGSVFDLNGGRFGYGGGFYDRFIAKIPTAIRIALAFELQLEEHLPLQPHDELMDYIITEKRIIICKRGRLVNNLSDR